SAQGFGREGRRLADHQGWGEVGVPESHGLLANEIVELSPSAGSTEAFDGLERQKSPEIWNSPGILFCGRSGGRTRALRIYKVQIRPRRPQSRAIGSDTSIRKPAPAPDSEQIFPSKRRTSDWQAASSKLFVPSRQVRCGSKISASFEGGTSGPV